MSISPSNLQIGPLVTGSNGAKIAVISQENGPAMWMPEAMQPVFEPKTFEDGATRMTLVLHPAPEQEAYLKSLDAWCRAAVLLQSEQLFGKALTLQQITQCYQSSLKTSDNYPPNLRIKIALTGANATRYWNSAGQKTNAPDTWLGNTIRPRIRIKALRFMAKQFGIVMELTDAQILQVEAKCPFT